MRLLHRPKEILNIHPLYQGCKPPPSLPHGVGRNKNTPLAPCGMLVRTGEVTSRVRLYADASRLRENFLTSGCEF